MPVVAFGASAWITDVLDSLERQLAAGTGLPRDKVLSYLGRPEDLLSKPQADRFISVTPEDFPLHQATVTGGGAEWTRFDGRFTIHVFARLGTDKELSDFKLLRDRSVGLAELVKKAVKSVQQWFPQQTAAGVTSSILIEPARLGSVRFNPRNPKPGWAFAGMDLGCKFRTDFTKPIT